jgi:TonB-dependent receptor
MNKIKFIIIAVSLMISMLAFGQKGTIRGTVYDGSNGETLVGVSVVIKGSYTGTATDLDGKFSLDVDPGTYDLQLSFISFQPLIVEHVEVKAGDVTVLNNLQLSESTVELQDVVVTANAIRNTEAALNTMKAKSSVMLDGISAAKIELIGDGTAVEAAKRVTGVTIEDEKYVYVRGLGDRYSKTTLNNMDIPGLDPDRNSLQMDIFPTSIVDNIVVSKNFTADLPADFTGGLVNITTKDFPDKKIFNVSVSTEYNPSMNLNSDYLTYDGGGTDFLGFDDGTRALPDIPDESQLAAVPGNGETIGQFMNEFSPTLAAEQKTSLLNYSASISLGNQIDLEGNSENASKLGYVFSLSYKSKYKFDDDVLYSDYLKADGDNEYEMVYTTKQGGEEGERNVLIGILGGLAYKNNLNKIQLTAMRLQNGISSAGKFSIDNNAAASSQSGFAGTSDQLSYNQRSITNILLHGSHVRKKSGWDLDWRVSPTFSISDDPDIRKTAFTHQYGKIFFNSGAAGFPSRIWRELSETNISSRADLTKNYDLLDNKAVFKFGISHNYKNREYKVTKLGYLFSKYITFPEADASLLLKPENYYYDDDNGYLSLFPEISPSNQYKSNVNNAAVYVSNEFYPVNKLKAILGVRMEKYIMRHKGQSQDGDKVLNNDKVLDATDFFPSANLIYEVSGKQNIRAAYSRTIARPSFKELSFAQIVDPLSNTIFNGGLYAVPKDNWDGNLRESYIDNFDLRWELFWPGGQNISASIFYKQFNDPIELVRMTLSYTSTEYQPRNVGDGKLYGFEFELNRDLDFIAVPLKNFNFSANVTITKSEIEMTDSEYNSRKALEKDGESIERTRDMAGQSPYVINTGITYNNYENGFSSGLFYNVKGSTLSIVGAGAFPDMYTEPFNSLNFSLKKKFGKDKKTKVDFKVTNILGETNEQYFKSYKAQDQPYKIYHPGREFSVGLSYSF